MPPNTHIAPNIYPPGQNLTTPKHPHPIPTSNRANPPPNHPHPLPLSSSQPYLTLHEQPPQKSNPTPSAISSSYTLFSPSSLPLSTFHTFQAIPYLSHPPSQSKSHIPFPNLPHMCTQACYFDMMHGSAIAIFMALITHEDQESCRTLKRERAIACRMCSCSCIKFRERHYD